ncbi:MAG: TolC family outer membrane protein [Geminicoccaceae bacterium]
MKILRPIKISTFGCECLGFLVGICLISNDLSAATIEDSIEWALHTNPDVGVVEADRMAIDQELRQARALYMPSIDLRAAVGPEYTNSLGTRGRATRPVGGRAAATLVRQESQLTLTQMLFDGFATESEVERQLARTDSAAYRVEEAAEFVALDAIEAHLDVLRNQVLVAQSKENLAAHQEIFGRVRQGEQRGSGSIADVRQTEARLAAARSVLATAIGNLRDAEARYVRVTGARPEELENAVAPMAALPEGPETAAAIASVNSPTVQIATADIDVAKAELKGSRAGYYPRFDLELGTAANRQIDGIVGSEVEAQALLVMRYNLFRGGGDIAREREAFSRVSESRHGLRKARNETEEQARISYNALMTARSRVDALAVQRRANAATRDAYAEQFNLGQRSLLDLLDAENEYYLARANLTTAEFTEDFAIYRVLAVTGDLLPTLEIDRPKEGINIFREKQNEG